MYVKMLTTAAGPDAIYLTGKTYNVPSAKAKAWIKEGYALLDVNPKKVTRVPPQPDPEDIPELPEDEDLQETGEDEEDGD